MDQDTLELLERRLAERVESRVRNRLLAVGTLVFGVIGFFGYNVVTGLKDQAREFAETAVAPSVEAADAAAAAARDKAAESAARLEAFAEFQKRREDALFESEKQAEQNQARIDRIGDEIEGQLGQITSTMQDTRAQVEALSARANETAGIGNIAELATNLAQLTAQVGLLDEQLREIRNRAQGDTFEAPQADARQIETIQRAATAQAQVSGIGGIGPAAPADGAAVGGGDSPQGSDLGPNTVYFQFTGVPRETAKAISARLAPAGFEFPGEERIDTAAGLHEVRYFFAEDRARAQALAEATNAILRQSGYRAAVAPRDVTDFGGKKPRPGTLELWLEPERG